MQAINKFLFEQHWLLSHLLSVVFSVAINMVNFYANEAFWLLSWDMYPAGGHCTSFTHPTQTAAVCFWKMRCLNLQLSQTMLNKEVKLKQSIFYQSPENFNSVSRLLDYILTWCKNNHQNPQLFVIRGMVEIKREKTDRQCKRSK